MTACHVLPGVAKMALNAQRSSCGRVWSCVVECGRVWSCVVVCGRVWPCVVLCGRARSCVVVCGRVWSCVATRGFGGPFAELVEMAQQGATSWHAVLGSLLWS